MSHRRFITVLWVVVAVLVGAVLMPLLMERDQNDPDTVALFIFAMAVLLFAGYKIIEEWRRVMTSDDTKEPAGKLAREALKAGMPDTAPPEPDDASGLQAKLSSVFERVPLEKQIADFAAAGLTLSPGRTVEEVLSVWPREEYEKDPYQCLLFTYAIEVETEPRGRWFCKSGWNWDTECIFEPGSYVEVLRNIERLTGQEVFSALFDNAEPAASGMAEITYAIRGGEIKKAAVILSNDWADVQAVSGILLEIQDTIGDGRQFYAGDNGQAVLVYFITADTAARLNKLKPGLLAPMV